jgi:glycosyltransferase involved in cell wall biosynthesis
VVHVGNIRPHKGHSNLIAAAKVIAENRPDCVIVSIGAEKHPGDLERVRSDAAAAGVEDMISFLGRREDARDFLATADVVVNPSDVEGLPVVLLEALSFRRPVVATDVGGVSQVIVHEKTGLLVPPGDPEALAAATLRALEDPLAPDWGDNGRDLVVTHHSMESMVADYEALYSEVLV